MKFTDKLFAIEIPCVLGTYDYDQAFLVDLLQEIENTDPKACWVSGAEKPTAYMPTNLGGNASGDASYLIYSATTNELGTSISTYLSTYPNCQLFNPLGKPLFINLIVHNVVRSQVAPAPWLTPKTNKTPGWVTTSLDPEWLRVSIPSQGDKAKAFFTEIEQIDDTIRWGAGKKPSESQNYYGDYIYYNIANNRLYMSSKPVHESYTGFTATGMFLERLRELRSSVIIPAKPDKDSRWNCKCSRCKEDAYQSPFSFECSKGCTNATSA